MNYLLIYKLKMIIIIIIIIKEKEKEKITCKTQQYNKYKSLIIKIYI